MAARTVILTAVCFAALTAIYLSTSSSSELDMTNTASGQAASSLDVELSTNSDTSSIKVTIHNTDPDRAISLLTWDTPLDDQAINSGILQLEDAKTGEAILSPGMMLNRMLPPPRDALAEIAPSSSISKDIALKSPWIPKDGKRYRAQMRGDWKAVWVKPAAQVTDEELSAMSGDQVSQGSFRSQSLEMDLQQ